MLATNLLKTKISLAPGKEAQFAEWQAALQKRIAKHRGFISLEILAPAQTGLNEWHIVQRFFTSEETEAWHHSHDYKELFKQLKSLISSDLVEGYYNQKEESVTEVIVVEVSPEKDDAFRDWIGKIHKAEAKFEGFRGVYVQSPCQNQSHNWITLLQFDTPEHLDHWLNSEERRQVLKEGEGLIASLESHRVLTSYSGWFSSLAKEGEPLPDVWKQTMLILLVLFPVVMLELKFLSPHLHGVDRSLATFISNAISVIVLAWPLTPLAIYLLRWWLAPIGNKQLKTLLGTLLVLALYALEIAIFWKVL